ncbi:hypothetical protein TNCV_832091 [Trichonephila clavipes]|nr:hypothetical protein TNCV_832091 [Trichonephila clavipes]
MCNYSPLTRLPYLKKGTERILIQELLRASYPMARQPMRAKAYCAQHATLDPEVPEQMLRSGGKPDVKSPVLSSQASLVLILSTN